MLAAYPPRNSLVFVTFNVLIRLSDNSSFILFIPNLVPGLGLRVRVLAADDVKRTLTVGNALELVEKAFREKGLKRVQMPPKSYLSFRKFNGDLRVMPAYLEGLDETGVKIVNVHPDNPEKYGLPTVMATILLVDPKTGVPICIMDGTWITAMRTAAAAGVATKYLAGKDSKAVGVIGAGHQSPFQLDALHEVVKVESVRVYDKRKGEAERLAEEMGTKLGLNMEVARDIEKVVKGADILVTVTPVREPIVKNEWIAEGTHINAIGADAPGKEELEPEILKRAKVVVDDWEQTSHSGEINVPLSRGIITEADIHAEIGEIVAGAKPGRTSEDEITVFDSTGLAIQDIITAWHVYEASEKKDLGRKIRLY